MPLIRMAETTREHQNKQNRMKDPPKPTSDAHPSSQLCKGIHEALWLFTASYGENFTILN